MAEKELEKLMEKAISGYKTMQETNEQDIMLYFIGKINAYNEIANIMCFKLRVDYIRKLDEYKLIHE